MGVTVEQLMDAMVSALKAQFLNTEIAVYGGELTDADKVLQHVPKIPALLIGYGGGNYKPRGTGNMHWRDVSLTVFSVTRNLRDKSNTGALPMLETLFQLLQGNDLGLGIKPLDVLGDEALLNAKGISVYAVDVKTTLPVEVIT